MNYVLIIISSVQINFLLLIWNTDDSIEHETAEFLSQSAAR